MPSATRQAQLSSGHVVQVPDITTLYSTPVNGFQNSLLGPFPDSGTPNTTPLHIMSPRTQTEMSTTGLIIGIDPQGSATAVGDGPSPNFGPGFKLYLWVADPNGYIWFRSAPVFCNANEAVVTYDIDAFPVWIQVDQTSVNAPGSLIFHFMEM